MAWWLEGATSKHFGWVRNPSEAIFYIFGAREKIRNYFSGKNRFFPKNCQFFSDFFTFEFSFPKSFPTQLKIDFSSKNRPKKTIFLSLGIGGIVTPWGNIE